MMHGHAGSCLELILVRRWREREDVREFWGFISKKKDEKDVAEERRNEFHFEVP